MSIKKILLFLVVISVVFAFGFSAKAMTETERQALIAQIKAQIQSLLQQVAELRAKQGITPTAVSCHTFNNIIKFGSFGEEVGYLQTFLQKEGFTILSSEIANKTYGISTQAGVSAFQKKYASSILTPLFLTKPTGIAGRGTINKLNNLYACEPLVGETGQAGINFVAPINYLYKSTGYSDIETSLPSTAITENTILTLSPIISKKVTINGNARLNNSDSIIRVVLVDSNGNEYVVLEVNNMTNEIAKDILISDACEETCAFIAPITPIKLKIKVQNASILIQKVNLVAKNEGNDSKKSIASIIGSVISSLVGINTNGATNYTVVLEQARMAKLKKVQDTIQRNNLNWVAGETSISNLSYEEKKQLLNVPAGEDLPNLEGIEYYKGGIFGDNIKTSASYSSVVGIPDKVDYRNYNGKNWMTSIKDQGQGGNCFSFGFIGAMEAQINLSLGQNINLNLSEQQIPDCFNEEPPREGAGDNPFPYLNLYTNNMHPSKNFQAGIVDEGCDPYVGRDLRETPGGKIVGSACYAPYVCSNYKERLWKVADYTAYALDAPYWIPSEKVVLIKTADDLRKIIAEKGPLSSGVSPWGTWTGHGLVLMGYDRIQNYWIFKNSWGENWGEKGYLKTNKPLKNIGIDTVSILIKGPFAPPTSSNYWPSGSYGGCTYKEECVSAGKSSKYVVTDWSCKKTTLDLANKDDISGYYPVKACIQDPNNKNRISITCVKGVETCDDIWSQCYVATEEQVPGYGGKNIRYRRCYDSNYCGDRIEVQECDSEGNPIIPDGEGGSGTGPETKTCTITNQCENKIENCTPKYMWFSQTETDACVPGTLVPAISSDVNGCGIIPDNPANPKNPRLSGGSRILTCPGSGRLNDNSSICVPTICGPQVTPDKNATGADCGIRDDGCGRKLDCGDCSWVPGYVCVNNKCVSSGSNTCTPKTCAQLGKACGAADDGCGGKVDCGVCPTCVPKTCAELGFDCNVQSDGCGGSINCGTCASGSACVSGKCATGCGTQICAILGRECGWVRDNCGNYVGCQYNSSLAPGACPANYTCSATGKCIVQTVINPPLTGTIRCYNDNNCSNNGDLDGFITGQDVCDSAGLKLYSGYETNKCLFPGTTNSYCAKVITSELFQDCTKILGSVGKCANGRCY